MTDSAGDRASELRDLFFESAQELLQALNEEALKLEKHPGDSEVVRSIRRTVHTLKGDAAVCGFRELSELAHELEDTLATDVKASAHPEVAEIALQTADVFAGMLAAYRQNRPVARAGQLHERIQKLAERPEKKTRRRKNPEAGGAATWTEYEKLAIQTAQKDGRRVYHVTVHVDPLCSMPVAARQLVHNALQQAGEVLAIRPENATAASRKIEAAVASQKPAAEIESKCRIPSVVARVKAEALPGTRRKKKAAAAAAGAEVAAVPARAGANEWPADAAQETSARPPAAAGAGAAPAPSPATENILRVDAERIDNVLNLVGELIIGKSMLHQTLAEFGRRFPKEPMRSKFADAMAFQARVLNDLQWSVMKIRMVPVEQLFRRFPRLVRDVARQCGKEVELVLKGQDTDLDKSILDAVAEPLTHMVRNAVSHGIESAQQRAQCGKPARGTITLNAYHQGNQVIVEVRDDGRGIDPGRLRAKAVEMKLISAEEASRMPEAEALDLIFRPGFSTAEEITEISGRGVGMDVVQSVLQRMKGTVTVETAPGQGTCFRLKLPLTLAIIKSLMFRVEERLYAIPLNTVAEIARATQGGVHQVDNHEVLQLRNEVLPLIRLGHSPAAPEGAGSRKFFVLVISVGEKKYGLVVDGLVGEEELVIKALDDQVLTTDLVSGASILGDGRVVLILNLPAIVERIGRMRPAEAGGLLSGLLFGGRAAEEKKPGGSDPAEARV